MPIDLEGKPLYQQTFENPCPLCRDWNEKQKKSTILLCQRCWKPIKPLENVPVGFSSRIIDHWHDRKVSGVSGAKIVTKTICEKCKDAEVAQERKNNPKQPDKPHKEKKWNPIHNIDEPHTETVMDQYD